MPPHRPKSRLILFTPPLVARPADDTPFLPQLAEAVASGDCAAVVISMPDGTDERGLLKQLKPLVAAAQEGGAAALIAGPPDLVGKSGADGLHLTGAALSEGGIGLRDATARFRPDKIVGVGAVRMRDDAMDAGEAGADYVMFGEPLDEEPQTLDATLALLGWWADLFEVPCVGYAENAEAIGPLAATGADFVALGPFIWNEADPVAAVRAAAAILAAPPAPSPPAPAPVPAATGDAT